MSAGSASTSPAAVTIGAVTLSGSRPQRTDPVAMPSVTSSTNTDASIPPTTEMTT